MLWKLNFITILGFQIWPKGPTQSPDYPKSTTESKVQV
jgi:hypothetical protein